MSAINIDYQDRGRSFVATFWLNGVCLRLLVIGVLIAMMNLTSISLPLLAGALAGDLFLFVWQLQRFATVSADYLTERQRFWPVFGGYAVFIIAVPVMLAQWWMLYEKAEAPPLLPNSVPEVTRDAAVPEAAAPERYNVSVSRDGKSLSFSGIMASGSALDFQAALSDGSRVEEVLLNSPGGNLMEARRMARLILKRELNTAVTIDCAGTCTLVYLAGKERKLMPRARMGFHRYGLDFMQMTPHYDLEKERLVDQRYMRGRAINFDFIEKVFDLNRDAIWFPRQDELYRVGVANTE